MDRPAQRRPALHPVAGPPRRAARCSRPSWARASPQTLARTADLLRDDADHLDDLADAAYAALPDPLPVGRAAWSSRPPSAPASCAWRRSRAGARDAELFHEHVRALDALLTDWHGQGAVDLPGRVARRTTLDGTLVFEGGLSRIARACGRLRRMDVSHVEQDLVNVLFTEKQIQDRLGELARDIERDYEGQDLLIVGILRGAVMVMADLARSLERHVEMDWMAISSYGSGTKSSGVVRILKDLDTDITGRHVLIVDEIIDTGLTLSWLTSNLSSREPASVEICTLLRKPEALQMPVEVKYVGWDIPNEFVVGYGLDYRERYRNLRDIGTLAPHVYS